MKVLRLAGLAAGLALGGMGVAQAAPGYATANVNLRSGPDTSFPAVVVIPDGASVNIEGCLRDESWCDVRWGPNRGWVYSTYLAAPYQGRRELVPDWGLAAIGIPVIAFAASDYWGRHYVNQPWYGDRYRWYNYQPRPRPNWRPPPPGPRPAGWWRPGYAPPRPVVVTPGRPGGPGPARPPVAGGPGRPGGPGMGQPGYPGRPPVAGGPSRPGGGYGNPGYPGAGAPPQFRPGQPGQNRPVVTPGNPRPGQHPGAFRPGQQPGQAKPGQARPGPAKPGPGAQVRPGPAHPGQQVRPGPSRPGPQQGQPGQPRPPQGGPYPR